jgi:O-acetylserine/cysteine efflux transporter
MDPDRRALMAGRRLAARDLALVLYVVALWGFSFVAIKVGLREIPPFALASLRFFFAAVPLVLVVKAPRLPWRFVAGYGVAIGVCQFGLLFLGMKLGMPAGLSSVVIQVQVFFTVGLAVAFLGDPFRREDVLGAAVATIGVALLGVHKVMTGATSTLIGFLLVIAAALAWAIGNVIAKRAATRYHADMFALVVWSSLVPPLPLALLSFAFEGGARVASAIASASLLAWGSVLLLAWGATLFGFVSWARLLHRYPTAVVSPFALLIPVSGLASGAVFLGEGLAPLQLVGVALVLLGLAENVVGSELRARLRAQRR